MINSVDIKNTSVKLLNQPNQSLQLVTEFAPEPGESIQSDAYIFSAKTIVALFEQIAPAESLTKADVNKLIKDYVLPSYDGVVPSGTAFDHFVNLASQLQSLRQELDSYALSGLEYRLTSIENSISDFSDRLDALEAKTITK